jgi:RNA polymerase sigma-70 factor (ECF subfamily)
MTDVNERALVERCRSGEEDAFRDLVDRYKHLVFGLIARSIPDRSRTEDLAQDVFLRVHKGLPYFRGEARLATWIYRIVANVCAEQAGKPLAPVSLDTSDPDESALPGPAVVSSDRSFADLELRDRLDKAMARLPAIDRLLIAGHYLKDLRYEDLAEALDVPLGTVKTRLHRAKRTLRRILETEP